jgi:hypothetical protein
MALLAQISTLEVLSALLILFASFYFIFKPIVFQDNWEKATLAILGRDILVALDFSKKLYNASFFEVSLKEFLSKTTLANQSLIVDLFPEETLKKAIIVAANCSEEKIKRFSEWYGSLVVNKRVINIFFIPINLTSIPEYSDLLLICNYINLTDYKSNVLSYISKGKGLIEISDFPSVIDSATKEIFGIEISPQQVTSDVYINIPSAASSDIYYPYKFFYNIPLIVNATSLNTTTGNYIGNFTFRNYVVPFEIDYASKKVYFKTSTTIVSVSERQSFSLYDYHFFLSYILSNSSFAVSFKKIYNFTDFRGSNNVTLIDGKEDRIFLYEGLPTSKVPVAVLNTSKIAWIADFDRENKATHDQKLALLSLILSVSNRRPYFPQPTSAYTLTYLDIQNYDMYEPYKVVLRISYP